MRICAVIVAGGSSSRMGREKALSLLRGRSILERVAAALEAQSDEVVVNANGDPARFEGSGLSVLPDLRPDVKTPLAGVHAALCYAEAKAFDAVLTAPSDTPFLPLDLVRRLQAARRLAAIAGSAGQQHYLTGLWSPTLRPGIESALDQARVPRLQDWCRMIDAAVVDWPSEPYDPFFNVNTPEELADAQRIAAEFAL